VEGEGGRRGGRGEDSSQSLRSTVTADQSLSAVEVTVERSGAVAGLPKRLTDFTVDHVCLWLEAMELGEYAQVFRTNKIDGELLSELEERDLIEVGICTCNIQVYIYI